MYRITLVLIFCLLLLLSSAAAQKSRPFPNSNTVFESLPDAPDLYLVTIEKNGAAILDTPEADEAKTVTPGQLKDFFTALAAKMNSTGSTRGKDLVTFKSDPLVKIETVIAFINSVRVTYTSKIRIEADEGLFVRLPKLPDKEGVQRPAKPNPLTLVVAVGKDGSLQLNGEDQNSLSNTSKLTDTLKTIFRARDDNGVFREGTNIIETTVFLKVPLSMTWGDAVKAITAIRNGGSNRIGLQIDDLEQ